MRQPSTRAVAALAFLFGASCLALAAPAKTKKVQAKFHVADVETLSTIAISFDDLKNEDQQAISNAARPRASWSILVDGKLSTVGVQSVSVSLGNIHLQLSDSLKPDVVQKHRISILFAGDPTNGVQAESVDVKQPKPPKNTWFPPHFNFTTDKKNPNLDVSGSLQTGVNAKPQYEWNVAAKAPAEYNGSFWIFTAGPKFTGIASQQTNADPDSLSASFPTEFYFPYFPHTQVSHRYLPVNLSFNPIDYEFERKPKQEAVLSNGKATLHNYQQKNTNLIVSGQLQFVEAWWPVNININLGTELGAAVSRSVLNLTAKPGYSDNPLRAVAGTDMYFDLPKVAKYPFLTLDGHYTVRSPLNPEPFQQAGVNNGNEFYSTKARHYVAVNFARTIAKGANFTVQYRYGSLPPTFTFVDHQATIGFEVVLGK